MSDVSIIGKNSPLTAYVKLTFDGFSTGEIPPKYILSFSIEKIKDMTGNFKMTLLYAPNTFKRGDDYLGIKLSALFNRLNKTPTEDNKFTVPCTLEYGWTGTGIKVSYKQAVITGFSEDIEEGSFIKYSISGTLSESTSRASQTKIINNYDVNNDGEVNNKDLIVAVKNNTFTDEMFEYVTNYYDILSVIPAGKRLSDNIEILANYIFEGIYDIKVDHTDEEMEKDTKITEIVSTDPNKSSNSTLYQKLVNMVNSCYSLSGYDVTFNYINKTTGTTIKSYTDFIESDQSVEESIYYVNPGGFTVASNIPNNLSHGEANAEKRELATDKKLVNSLNNSELKVEKSSVKGDIYMMFFVEGDSHKYGKPTLRICPKSATVETAKFAHYTISNTNLHNNVLSYSQTANLIPFITAFNNIINNANTDVDADVGEFIFTSMSSLKSPLSQEQMVEYAHNYALLLLKQLNNTTTATLEVVFDRYSILLGIDDRIAITNMVNGGETLFNGDYWIKSATDSLENGMLKTTYELIYTDANIETYLKNKILQLMNELNPTTKSSGASPKDLSNDYVNSKTYRTITGGHYVE